MLSMYWRRVGAVGTLLSPIALAATLVAATPTRVAATSDLDAVGRHPRFRCPVEHEAMVDAMASTTTERRSGRSVTHHGHPSSAAPAPAPLSRVTPYSFALVA
jgi:hypothetical protein